MDSSICRLPCLTGKESKTQAPTWFHNSSHLNGKSDIFQVNTTPFRPCQVSSEKGKFLNFMVHYLLKYESLMPEADDILAPLAVHGLVPAPGIPEKFFVSILWPQRRVLEVMPFSEMPISFPFTLGFQYHLQFQAFTADKCYCSSPYPGIPLYSQHSAVPSWRPPQPLLPLLVPQSIVPQRLSPLNCCWCALRVSTWHILTVV